MSRPPVFALSAATLLPPALSARANTHTADVGTPVAVSHPVGAYSHEYRWGNNADVIYSVEHLTIEIEHHKEHLSFEGTVN